MRILLVSLIMLGLFSCKPTAETTKSSDKLENVMATYYLIRHAEKASDGTKNPDLNEEGRKRAQNLATQLKDKNIKYIYSTNYKRTRQTVAPLAKALGIEVEIYNPSDLENFKNKLLEKHQSREGVLVVGHSNTTPTLANLIVAINENHFKPLSEDDYGNFFIITYIKGGFKIAEKIKDLDQSEILPKL